ncbi:hypothetical protein Ocin01_00099 [Orchesella cincta]|uniref:Uncharacterized protein n=1 Tax=Orchesella cincta TaxID=48709 RepID=A0A1D2NNV2_ORCCI|nr:hypothetical protein Ocin01_00099 [Orchesella cincta]
MALQESGVGRALELTVSRGEKIKEKSTEDYGGVYYTNSLRVDRPIRLTGFTFFAPVTPGYTEYSVIVRKMRGEEVVGRFQVSKSMAELRGVTNQRIRINPPWQIPIEANVWYDVKFKIEGPKTPFLENKERDQVVYSDDPPRRALATFYFFTGSGQLPEYHFVLA